MCLFILHLASFPCRNMGFTHSLNAKLTKLVLPIRCPPYNLTFWGKSALIQKPTTQMPKAFYQYGKAEAT